MSLTAEKPNDVHSLLAKQISELLGRPFPRGTAKNVKYGCFPVDNTEVLTTDGWKYYYDLSVGDKVVIGHNKGVDFTDSVKKLWYYEDAEVFRFGNESWSVECTEDHRWVTDGGFITAAQHDNVHENLVTGGESISMKNFTLTKSRKTNVFCITTGSGRFIMRQNGVISVTGNCSYNAQVKRIAKTVGCSLEEAQIIFDTFWEQAFPLKQLKEAMQQYWETKGEKKFLLGIDGRKLPIRSKGNVINTAFQSAGVICAKRAMILHDRYLTDEGLLVDFFLDDWKNREDYSQQLISYHDEAQSEVTKKSVVFKTFKFEGPREIYNEKDEKWELSPNANAALKATKEFKSTQTDKIWSDVGYTDRMYFVAYCRSGELAAKAVKEAGQFYKLNVELTAGYVIGTNWANCH